MSVFTDRRRVLAIAGVFLAVALVASGIWFLVGRGGDGTAQPPAGQPTTPPAASPSAQPATMTVKVFFHQGGNSVVAVERTVPRSAMVATAALTQLLAGPTAAERDAGYTSHFSAATAGALRSVRVANGVAHADFHDFSRIIPNASSSAGSAALLAELDATLEQFSTVRATVYSFNGDVAAFYEWLQRVPPTGMAPSAAAARALARDFVTRVAGMDDPLEGAFRWLGAGVAAVDFRPRIGEDARPGVGPVTTVTLHRTAVSWTVVGAGTATISVSAPARGQAVSSPVKVSGRALAFEGVVNVRVVQVTGPVVADLGSGYVMGGGDVMRPFGGQVGFTGPGAGSGWIVFSESSAHNGEVAKVTAVQVAFAGTLAPPQILTVTMAPAPALRDGWVTLTGTGTLTFTVRAGAASQVRLTTTTLNTGAEPEPTVTGTARRSGDVFTYTWRYRNEPLLARVAIVATGPGGRAELVVFDAYHG